MRVAATYISNGRFEIDAADLEDFKPKHGEAFVVDIARRRNVGHHRKGFALLKAMHENQDKFEDIPFHAFRKWVVLMAGFVDTYTVGGLTYHMPHSLKFDAMDQTEFDDVYKAIVTVAVEQLNLIWALDYD